MTNTIENFQDDFGGTNYTRDKMGDQLQKQWQW